MFGKDTGFIKQGQQIFLFFRVNQSEKIVALVNRSFISVRASKKVFIFTWASQKNLFLSESVKKEIISV